MCNHNLKTNNKTSERITTGGLITTTYPLLGGCPYCQRCPCCGRPMIDYTPKVTYWC